MRIQNVERVLEPLDSAQITSGVRAGDTECMSALYSWIQRIVRVRISGPDLVQAAEDLCHETFIIAVEAIRADRLRNDVCLIAYINSIARNRVANTIERLVRDRNTVQVEEAAQIHQAHNSENPEIATEARERLGYTMSLLRGLSARDYEILYRFYVMEQSAEVIQEAVGLTATQFRLAKSRARARIIAGMRRHEKPALVRRDMTRPTRLKVEVAAAAVA